MLIADPVGARDVLTRSDDFVLPFDVTRRAGRTLGSADRPERKEFAPVSAAAVARGRGRFAEELARLDIATTWVEVDLMVALRRPIAMSTVSALRPDLDEADRTALADLTLAWIDALAPIIAAMRAPRGWSRVRRAERRVRRDLTRLLARLGSSAPATEATALAAGVQVPIAGGATALALLAGTPAAHGGVADPAYATAFVWELLRLYPPTLLMPRISTRDVVVGSVPLAAYTPVVVSPVALGRREELVPGPSSGHAPLDQVDPDRWLAPGSRPGAWLPFGSGLHACPGRNLGMAQLVALVTWASAYEWAPTGPFGVDDRRGLTPSPSTVRVRQKPVA